MMNFSVKPRTSSFFCSRSTVNSNQDPKKTEGGIIEELPDSINEQVLWERFTKKIGQSQGSPAGPEFGFSSSYASIKRGILPRKESLGDFCPNLEFSISINTYSKQTNLEIKKYLDNLSVSIAKVDGTLKDDSKIPHIQWSTEMVIVEPFIEVRPYKEFKFGSQQRYSDSEKKLILDKNDGIILQDCANANKFYFYDDASYYLSSATSEINQLYLKDYGPSNYQFSFFKRAEAKPAEAKPAEAKPEYLEDDELSDYEFCFKRAEAKPAEAKPEYLKDDELSDYEFCFKRAEAKPEYLKDDELSNYEFYLKRAEAKPAEAKPKYDYELSLSNYEFSVFKRAEAKPAEAKPAEAKPAEAKPEYCFFTYQLRSFLYSKIIFDVEFECESEVKVLDFTKNIKEGLDQCLNQDYATTKIEISNVAKIADHDDMCTPPNQYRALISMETL